MTDDNFIADEIREPMLAENSDIHVLIHDMERQTDASARAGHVVITRGPRPASASPDPTPAGRLIV